MVFAFIFHPCPANKPAKRLAQTQINVIRSISALRYVQKLFTPPCSVVRPSRRASAASERAAERDSTVNDAAKRRSPLFSLGPTDTAEPNARTPEWDCWGGREGGEAELRHNRRSHSGGLLQHVTFASADTSMNHRTIPPSSAYTILYYEPLYGATSMAIPSPMRALSISLGTSFMRAPRGRRRGQRKHLIWRRSDRQFLCPARVRGQKEEGEGGEIHLAAAPPVAVVAPSLSRSPARPGSH